MSFTVVIVGRPNVGKSTLFNRLVNQKRALVNEASGVTRDRREGQGRIADLTFRVIDTAGLDEILNNSIEARMRQQTAIALEEADVILFLIDARTGVTPPDIYCANYLRGYNKPIYLIVNKCEGSAGNSGLYEAYNLGMGDPIPLSAEHGEGMTHLYEILAPFALPKTALSNENLVKFTNTGIPIDQNGRSLKRIDEQQPLQLAIIGRPNVGKSTLINFLLGKERVLTGPEPGITRDSISISWLYKGHKIQLIDTAGLRRRSKIYTKIDQLSAADSLRSIRFAQVAILLIDATCPFEKQDLTIAREVIEEGRALVIGINKWDMIKNHNATMDMLYDKLENSLPQIRGISMITFSALTGRGVNRLMPAVMRAYKAWNRRIATSSLNRWLSKMLDYHPPPLIQSRRIKLRYITQAKTRPPTFIVFTNHSAQLPETYLRYLINGLREDFNIPGIPLRLFVRKGKNPYIR